MPKVLQKLTLLSKNKTKNNQRQLFLDVLREKKITLFLVNTSKLYLWNESVNGLIAVSSDEVKVIEQILI